MRYHFAVKDAASDARDGRELPTPGPSSPVRLSVS
jgi:hypothetical protein